MKHTVVNYLERMHWEHDRDIPDGVWNRYMKRYGDQYRLTKDEINIWHLRCKFGTVQLHSLLNHQLCFVGDFRSRQHKTWFKKKIANKNCTVSQEGDMGIVVVFDEKILDSLADCLRLYRKKKISEDYRRVFVERMKRARLARKKR